MLSHETLEFKDSYGQGFPPRWYYTLDKLTRLISAIKLEEFFNIILGKRYLMIEMGVPEVDAVVLRACGASRGFLI